MSASPARRAPLLAIAVLAVLAVALFVTAGPPSSEAQAPATRTIVLKELEKGSTFKHVRNTKTTNQRSMAMGDLIAFTNPLADATGQRVGKIYVTCTGTVGNKNFLKSILTCSGVLTLRDGTMSVVANTSPGEPTTTGAVVGGTGAYAAARGVLVSKEGSGGSDDTITLVN